MIDLTLVVVAKNEENARRFSASHGCLIVVNSSRRSLASIGNSLLDKSSARVFGLCHADMEFGPGSLQAFYDCAIQGAVCGACGRNMLYADGLNYQLPGMLFLRLVERLGPSNRTPIEGRLSCGGSLSMSSFNARFLVHLLSNEPRPSI